MGYDGVVQIFIVAAGDRNGNPLALIANLDDDFGCFQVLNLLLDQLLPCFLFEMGQVGSAWLCV